MAKDKVDLYVELRGKVFKGIERVTQKLEAGGPVAKKWGRRLRGALEMVRRHSAVANKGLRMIGRTLLKVGKIGRSVLSGLARRLAGTVKWIILGGIALIGWQVKKGFDIAKQLESAQISLQVLTKSAARARALMDWIVEFSAVTPFRFPELMEGTRMLQAYGLAVKKWMPIIGDVSAGVQRPLEQVIRAIGYLSTGVAGEAAESLRRMGINLRTITSLKFNAQNQLITPIDEAMVAVRGFLNQRFGGMMEKQSKTWAGAWSTFTDLLDLLREKMVRPVFKVMTADLRSLNIQLEAVYKSRKVSHVIEEISNAALKLYARLKPIGRAFSEALSAGKGLGGAIKASWEQALPTIKAALELVIKWAARVFAFALKTAFQEAWKASPGAKLAIGGLVTAMVLPTVIAGTSLALQLGAGGAIAAGGAAVGGAAVAGGAAIAPAAIAALPLVLAAVVGYLGGKAITAHAGRKERKATEEMNVRSWEERGKRRMATTRAHLRLDKEIGDELERQLAVYQKIVATREKLAQDALRARNALGDEFEVLAKKLRTPEETLAKQNKTLKDLEHSLAQAAKAVTTPVTAKELEGEERKKFERKELSTEKLIELQREKATRAYSRQFTILEKIGRVQLQIAASEIKRKLQIIAQNRAFRDQWVTMNALERGKFKGFLKMARKSSAEQIAGMSSEDRRYLMGNRVTKEIIEKRGLMPEIARKLGFEGLGLKTEGAGVSQLQTVLDKLIQRIEAKKKETEAVFDPEKAAAAMATAMQEKFTLRLSPETIQAVIKLDTGGDLEAAIKKAIDDLQFQIQDYVYRNKDELIRKWGDGSTSG